MSGTSQAGRSLNESRMYAMIGPHTWTANTADVLGTSRFAVPPGVGKLRILGIHAIADAIPADPDGVMTMDVIVYDASEAGSDTIVAAQDLETLLAVANRCYECTLAAETSEVQLTLEAGDSIRFTLTNDSAALGTNANVHVVVEYVAIPRVPSEETQFPVVRYESQYAQFGNG